MNKALLVLAALALGAPHALAQEQETASAEFLNPEGESVGTATVTGAPEGVLFEVEVSNLPAEQWLAIHVHEVGECDPEDDFESAGDHFDPTDRPHGYLAEGGPHVGDLPNQHVDSDGVMRAHIFNSFATLGEGETDVRGRSLMIHEGEDDYESQPTGEAGGRLACAVIE